MGVEGPASFTVSPRSLASSRTRPHSEPATTMSPILRVPRWISTVATGAAALVQLGLDHRAFGGAVGDWP